MLKRSIVFVLVLAACGGAATGGGDSIDRADIPVTTAADFETHLASIDKPAVVNVWASWCLPCRAEAHLFNEAFARYGDKVEFIGVDVQDNQVDAKAFLAEFGLEFDHFFDRNREVANHYLGIGTPITLFFGPNGQLIKTHNGIVDDRLLALNIDEILHLSS